MGLFDKLKRKEHAVEGPASLVPGVGRMPYPAYRGKAPYIFVSYCHSDSGQVFREIKEFNEHGFHVWYDEGISPGNEWTDEIARALIGCSLFVVFFTPNSAVSDNVQNEIDFAIDEKKPCLAIHLSETTLLPRTRLRFGMKQAILKYNMTQEEYIYKFISAFEGLGMHQCLKNASSDIAPAAPAIASQPFVQAEASSDTVTRPANRDSDALIEEIQNSPVRMSDFEWIDSTIKAYHGIKKYIEVPDKATKIMTLAFKGNPAAEHVILPESVVEIGANVFFNCPNLESVVIKNSSVDFAEIGPIKNCPKAVVKCKENSVTHERLKNLFNGSIIFLAD